MAFEVLRAGNFLHAHVEKVRTRPEDVGPNVRANVEEGLRYTLEDHVRAAAAQTRIYRDFQRFFDEHDVLITPGHHDQPAAVARTLPDGDRRRADPHLLPLAGAGLLRDAHRPPGGQPAGRAPTAKGMPFGLQIVGPRGGDAFVLGVAAALEEAFASDPALRRPVPDIAALRSAPPISGMEGFLGFA